MFNKLNIIYAPRGAYSYKTYGYTYFFLFYRNIIYGVYSISNGSLINSDGLIWDLISQGIAFQVFAPCHRNDFWNFLVLAWEQKFQ